MTVRVHSHDKVLVVTIDRPFRRNAVDTLTAEALALAFREFDADDSYSVAVLTGAEGSFCSGADLYALAAGEARDLAPDGDGPMGPTRLRLGKPVLAAIEGYAVAGGLELAIWCDLRVAAEDAVLGVFNRRFGVPLVDLGTVRLPRLIGQGRALDLILTGREVRAAEALAIGLVDRVVPSGAALDSALELAGQLAGLPQIPLRSDRRTVLDQWGLSEDEAARLEVERGRAVLESGETRSGVARFASGAGRHGT
jgi:enoyl-CoA hydratase